MTMRSIICVLCFHEIFGEENFFAQIIVQSNKRGQTYKDVAKTHEYLVVYGRSDEYLFELQKDGDALPLENSKGRFDLWELRNATQNLGATIVQTFIFLFIFLRR